MRIYVGNLPYSTTEEASRAEFEVYGREAPIGANLAAGKPVTASPGGWGSPKTRCKSGRSRRKNGLTRAWACRALVRLVVR